MRPITKITALLAFVSLMTACRILVPILNVSDAPVISSSTKPLSQAQVRTAVIRAGAQLGWKVTDDGSDKLAATIALRENTATISIPYSAKSYSIMYVSSSHLHENGSQIHPNYNGWIQNLNKAINTQLALAAQ